ncbi:TPA: hypothetical protein MHU33_05050 [Klebsiella pneumoniae]|nr:hypothetical protein [Klebsiella pneumoniae]
MAAYSEVELILFIVQKAPWSAGRLGPIHITERVARGSQKAPWSAGRLGPIHITERVARGRSPWQILND